MNFNRRSNAVQAARNISVGYNIFLLFALLYILQHSSTWYHCRCVHLARTPALTCLSQRNQPESLHTPTCAPLVRITRHFYEPTFPLYGGMVGGVKAR